MSEKRLLKCKKIGIMGGTFNPIHIGHLLMAQWAKDFAGLEAVIFMPTGNSYMKETNSIIEGQKRLEMVRLSIDEADGFYSSDMEILRGGNTYTYETLQELKQIYPDAELYFIVGADSLYNFERWVHPELILKYCTLIAAARDGVSIEALDEKRDELTKRFGGNIELMQFPAFDVSSTMIRARVRENKSIRYLVTDGVCEYIKDNGLYL